MIICHMISTQCIHAEDVGSGFQRAPAGPQELLVLVYRVAVGDMLCTVNPLFRPVRENGNIRPMRSGSEEESSV